MSIIKKTIAALFLAAGLYAAYLIYQQSQLAGVLLSLIHI